MLPHLILTAATILRVDLGHHLGKCLPAVVGAGVFTGHVDRGAVDFSLDTFVLTPSDRSSSLFTWLDRVLSDGRATVCVYDLIDVIAALDTLPDAGRSSALRRLRGYGSQQVIDSVSCGPDPTSISFVDAARTAGIPCTVPDPDIAFEAWMTGRQAVLVDKLATDAIASWRFTMNGIADRSAIGHRVNAAIERHLIEWLRHQGTPATALHLHSLARTKR